MRLASSYTHLPDALGLAVKLNRTALLPEVLLALI